MRNSYSNHINHNCIFPLFRVCYMNEATTADYCYFLFCDQRAVNTSCRTVPKFCNEADRGLNLSLLLGHLSSVRAKIHNVRNIKFGFVSFVQPATSSNYC